jgi:hypothetical protein
MHHFAMPKFKGTKSSKCSKPVQEKNNLRATEFIRASKI